MATYTKNYELTKPDAATEYYDVNVQNENMNKIDAALEPTADPEQIPTSNGPGKLQLWISWIANRIKAITGKANWYDAPATTLEAAKSHLDAAAPHAGHETLAGAQAKVNTAMAAHTNTTDPHSQYAMDTDVSAIQNTLSAHTADYVRQPGYGVTTGSSNTYTLTLNPAPATYADGTGIKVKIHAANTGASTININGLGAKALVNGKGVALTSGKLILNGIYSFVYNSTSGNFILQGEGGEYGTAGAPQVLSGYTVGTENGLINGVIPIRTNNEPPNPTQYPEAINDSMYDGHIHLMPPAGYYNGDTWVHRTIPELTAANIRQGVTIGTGTGGKILGTLIAIDQVEAGYSQILYASTVRGNWLTEYKEAKKIQINVSGTVRISFNLKQDQQMNPPKAYGRIYKNDVPIGLERSTTANYFTTYTEDFVVNKGDFFQLFLRTDSAAAPSAVSDLMSIQINGSKFGTTIIS